MKLAGRGAIAGAVVVGAAVLVLFGCGVDDHFPGLPNEIPNPEPPQIASTGAGATGGGGGPANVCECAAADFSGESSACALCVKAVSAPGQGCGTEWSACAADQACEAIVTCLGSTCSGADGGSIQACIDTCLLPLDQDDAHKKMNDLLTCVCATCGSCTFSSAVSCTPGQASDAGAD